MDVLHVDEDGLGWQEVDGEPGSFAVVDTKAINPKEETMAGATLTKEAQASGKSRADKGAEKKQTEAKPKPATKAKVKVRPIPDDYIKHVVAAVKKGTSYADIARALADDKVEVPEGYKEHYPAVRASAIRKFGSVAAAREAMGKKNA